MLRFENMELEFERAVDAIGMDLVRPLPRANETKERSEDFWQYIDAEARHHAMNVFGPFFREWNYHFPVDWPTATARPIHDAAYRTAVRALHLASSRLGWSPRRCVQAITPLQLLTKPLVHQGTRGYVER